MKIGIIGAGFGGLAAAHRLAKEGFDVTVFESEGYPGGLAVGFKEKGWKWSLEKHYHHWFYSDFAVKNLAKEIGHNFYFKKVKTSTFIKGSSYRLDSPISLMLFRGLPLLDRIRTGLVLAFLRLTPFWKLLEDTSAKDFLKKYNGKKAWKVLWEPLFEKKFGPFANGIPASWFLARIKLRSASLGYPEGGFLKLATRLDAQVQEYKGRILYRTRVEKISKEATKLVLVTDKGKFEFDRVICTLPFAIFARITEGLPTTYVEKLLSFKGVGAVNLILFLKRPFFKDGTYWLNVNETSYPFLAVVEHTNFMDKKNYGGENIIYVGNYLPRGHRYYESSARELLKEFIPFLQKINHEFTSEWVNRAYLFTAPFAQPVVPLNYSKVMPSMITPIEGLFLANIQQVYPWDRGTNYAVELGEKVVKLVKSS